MSDLLFPVQFMAFEAARRLPAAPATHPEHRMHGHGFRVAAMCAQRAGFEALQERAQALDYSALHERLDDASDAGILSHLAAGAPESPALALQSAPGRGVRRDVLGRMLAWGAWSFESAHRLPNVPPGHKCGRLHGHGFRVVLHVPLLDAQSGWNADYARLAAAWQPLQERLHRQLLNALPGLENPTSEWLAVWIWQALQAALPTLHWVTVYETAGCGAHYDGQVHRIWKDFTLDSATCDRVDGAVLGHTYTIRLHLQDALHAHFGWAMDFADVKMAFTPLFQALDHQPLHELPQVESPDCQGIAQFVRARAAAILPPLRRVDVFDGTGSGVVLDWGLQGLQVMP